MTFGGDGHNKDCRLTKSPKKTIHPRQLWEKTTQSKSTYFLSRKYLIENSNHMAIICHPNLNPIQTRWNRIWNLIPLTNIKSWVDELKTCWNQTQIQLCWYMPGIKMKKKHGKPFGISSFLFLCLNFTIVYISTRTIKNLRLVRVTAKVISQQNIKKKIRNQIEFFMINRKSVSLSLKHKNELFLY